MTLPAVSAAQARELIDAGALLVDIREADEFAREHISFARLVPLSTLPSQINDDHAASRVIFHCRSGARTQTHAARLAESVNCQAYVLEGGIEAWKRAGLPVTRAED